MTIQHRHFLPRGDLPVFDGVLVEYRRTIFSETRDIRPFEHGATIADMIAAFDKPIEFSAYGAVFLKRDVSDEGHEVSRDVWHLVRPKPGTSLFISCVPQGGNAGGIFQIVASIALIALTAWVGGGGIGLIAPALSALAPGQVGASVAAAAIGVAGSCKLSVLSDHREDHSLTDGRDWRAVHCGLKKPSQEIASVSAFTD